MDKEKISFGDFVMPLAILLVLVMFGSKAELYKYNWEIIATAGALIAFLAIFVPLIVKRLLEKKKELFLEQQWKEKSKEFEANYASIKQETSKPKKDFASINTFLERLQKIIEDMTYVETELGFDKFTGKGIKVLIGSMIFALISLFTNNSNIIESFNLTWNQISFTCLIFGIAYTYRIIQNWFELHKQTKTVLEK